jgi:hypothetical protein
VQVTGFYSVAARVSAVSYAPVWSQTGRGSKITDEVIGVCRTAPASRSPHRPTADVLSSNRAVRHLLVEFGAITAGESEGVAEMVLPLPASGAGMAGYPEPEVLAAAR